MIILDMDMPKNCDECPCFKATYGYKCGVTMQWTGYYPYRSNNKIPKECPIKGEYHVNCDN